MMMQQIKTSTFIIIATLKYNENTNEVINRHKNCYYYNKDNQTQK